MNAAKNLLEAGIINNFEAGGKLYTMKKPFVLKFSKLEDKGWENHILAEPENENDNLLGWEGVGYPGKQEASEDFRARLGESFEEYALCDPDELTEAGEILRRQLLGMVETINTNDLNEILKECARLRGVYRLQHRILKEFDWFVSTIIFKKWDDPGIEDPEELQALKKFAGRHEPFKNDENARLDWGRLFLEYYREQAEEWEQELEEEIKELFEEEE